MFDPILLLYGINPAQANIQPFGDGLINHTWMVSSNEKSYILQKVNTDVFKDPAAIDKNLSLLRDFLKHKDPRYLFVAPLKNKNGQSLQNDAHGCFRIFPFIQGSSSLSSLTHQEEAYEAARQFGKFSAILNDFETNKLNITIPDFHNLELRYEQFTDACTRAIPERMRRAKTAIHYINEHAYIVKTYSDLVADDQVPLRVIHHDTKISNVLFDKDKKGICVIDLDTVMPGYFISDVGDMMRTYLCESTEEETDLSKISIRKDFFKAIYKGYMQEMAGLLTAREKKYFSYAGKFIIYMQAMRFLTDYLLEDIYYGAKYEDHNLNRANNQIGLLSQYIEMEPELVAYSTRSEVKNLTKQG